MRVNLPVTQRENTTFSDEELICSKTDREGIITYANRVFSRISGFSERELIGAPQNITRHPDMPCVVFAWCWETLQAGSDWRGIVKNRCKNGDHYWVEANIYPQVDAGGAVLGYASIRRKPTAGQVTKADALYAKLRRAEGVVEARAKLSRQAVMELYRNSPLYRLRSEAA